MSYNINNKLDDTFLFGSIGAVLLCIGLFYKRQRQPEPEYIPYERPLLGDTYNLMTVDTYRGGSKTRRKNKY